MANTYTQLNVHAVFSVKGRGNFIAKKWCDELYKYLAGTLKETKNYPLAVGGYKDHVHIFFELSPTISVSDVLKCKSQIVEMDKYTGFCCRKIRMASWLWRFHVFTVAKN